MQGHGSPPVRLIKLMNKCHPLSPKGDSLLRTILWALGGFTSEQLLLEHYQIQEKSKEVNLVRYQYRSCSSQLWGVHGFTGATAISLKIQSCPPTTSNSSTHGAGPSAGVAALRRQLALLPAPSCSP